jgi:hypothetical protein
MTRQERIQTILRSEVLQWRTMTKGQLINCLIVERTEVLEDQTSDMLDYMLNEVDVAEVWGQAI